MDFLGKYLKVIDNEVSNVELPSAPENLYEPIGYFLQLGGKRVRPIIALMACRLFNDNFERATPIANLVELFHNFSLVHDDIMDDAPLRRGKQTVHEKWDNNIAILSGDMILIKAYQEIEKLSVEDQAKILKVFNLCAVKVCEGQQWDMDFEQRDDVTVEEYINMIYLKTSALLEHSLEMGAIVGGANNEQIKHVMAFGKNLGIAFQLRDDLLDVFSEADFGKQKAGDIISNKKTYLMLKALEKADTNQRELMNHWLSIQEFDDSEKVAAIIDIYNQLDIRQETETMIAHYSDIAVDALKNLKGVHEDTKMEFEMLQTYLMNRDT